MLGNVGWSQANPSGDQWALVGQVNTEPPANSIGPMPIAWRRSAPLATLPNPITVEPVSDIEASILPTVGASRQLGCDGKWLMTRDRHDKSMVEGYQTNTGTATLHQDEGRYGGYPPLAAGTACPDTDNDGMPNAWEVKKGFNPSVANNNAAGTGGYTQLENFLSGEEGAAVPAPPGENKFADVDRVRVTSTTINVRASASVPAGTLLGTQPLSAQGVVIDGPTPPRSGTRPPTPRRHVRLANER